MSSKMDLLFEKGDENVRIKRHAFWISSGILFTIAVLTALGRVFLKVRHKMTFTIDDYIVFFATLCFISGTGVLYAEIDNLYIAPALNKHPELTTALSASQMGDLAKYSFLHQRVYFILFWSCIFGVKASFLAFFKKMIGRMKKITIFWWVTVAITAPSWVVFVSIPFIYCPHVGASSIICIQHPNNKVSVATMYIGGVLDIVTDLLIVSIPVLVLYRVKLPTRQKFIVGTFLCLSLSMVIMALVRCTTLYGKGGHIMDITWSFYWLHVEACVAIIMVSLTSFRTTFNVNRSATEDRARLKQAPTYIRERLGKSGGTNDDAIELQGPSRNRKDKGGIFSIKGRYFGESAVELSRHSSSGTAVAEREDIDSDGRTSHIHTRQPEKVIPNSSI